jgi:hypothetical protein
MTEQIHSLIHENARQLAHAKAQGAQLRRAAQAELARVEARLESMAPGGIVADAARRDEYMALVTQRDQLRRAVA